MITWFLSVFATSSHWLLLVTIPVCLSRNLAAQPSHSSRALLICCCCAARSAQALRCRMSMGRQGKASGPTIQSNKLRQSEYFGAWHLTAAVWNDPTQDIIWNDLSHTNPIEWSEAYPVVPNYLVVTHDSCYKRAYDLELAFQPKLPARKEQSGNGSAIFGYTREALTPPIHWGTNTWITVSLATG